MMGKVLEKLKALDENARVLAAIRAKKTNVHLEQRKKPLTTPLLSDLHEEFGGTIAPSAPKTVTESVEDKSCNLKKSKIRVSFKYKTEPRSAFEESDLPGLATNKKYAESKLLEPKRKHLKLSPRSLRYLKDQTEAIYANSLHLLQSQPRNQCKRSPESPILHPTPPGQTNANQNEKRAKKSMYSTDHSADSIEKGKKHHPLVNDLITKENESASDNQARTSCPVKQNALLPLHFEDVLKNPTVKIIDLAPKETVLCFMEESHTNPIIFHDTAYIEMLFLAKRFTPYVMTYTRKNLVLEKNWEMLKGLFYDQPSIVSKPQRPKPVVQYKELTLFSTQRVQKSIKEKRKKKHDSLASKNTPPDTFYNLSRTISNITKRFVGYFEIDATQEKSAITDEFERIFSKTKPPPTRKFTTLPIKYESKPLKNTVEIRKLNNITPLDNLLSWKVNN
ncbi:RGD1562532 [Phodopus roborovskii]|uniref:RGD1562532 protein n=1 Tax=Phodopus roborovskii TaxID=109678 RepID=A0AAU9ZD17_PHORO|nr:RGD1562532 [Phodopus roborovskii]